MYTTQTHCGLHYGLYRVHAGFLLAGAQSMLASYWLELSPCQRTPWGQGLVPGQLVSHRNRVLILCLCYDGYSRLFIHPACPIWACFLIQSSLLLLLPTWRGPWGRERWWWNSSRQRWSLGFAGIAAVDRVVKLQGKTCQEKVEKQDREMNKKKGKNKNKHITCNKN